MKIPIPIQKQAPGPRFQEARSQFHADGPRDVAEIASTQNEAVSQAQWHKAAQTLRRPPETTLTPGMLSDLQKFKAPSPFPAPAALRQTLQDLLLGGRFLSSFGPALNGLLQRIGQENLSPQAAQELLQGFAQLSSSGQAALSEKNQDLPKALKAESRERSRAWDRALQEEPLHMTAWAQLGAARELGMHGGPGLQGEPGMAEPIMKLFRALANADKTCQQATLQVQGLLNHLEQIGVAEVDLAIAYLESYQRLTSLGRHPEITLRSLDETLQQLDPSPKFRHKPGQCLTEAVELGLLCPSPAQAPLEIEETKEEVVIGGIHLKKKKPLAQPNHP